MDCRDSALFTGVDEASCENMLRCFSAYEQRFSAGQTILTVSYTHLTLPTN